MHSDPCEQLFRFYWLRKIWWTRFSFCSPIFLQRVTFRAILSTRKPCDDSVGCTLSTHASIQWPIYPPELLDSIYRKGPLYFHLLLPYHSWLFKSYFCRRAGYCVVQYQFFFNASMSTEIESRLHIRLLVKYPFQIFVFRFFSRHGTRIDKPLICVWAVSRHFVQSIVDKKWLIFLVILRQLLAHFLCLQRKELLGRRVHTVCNDTGWD